MRCFYYQPLPILLICSTFLAGCCDNDASITTDSESRTVLFPLSIGQYWVYQIDSPKQSGTVRNYIANSKTIGDKTWYQMVEYGERFWIRNHNEGQSEAVNLYNKKETDAVFEQLDVKTVREELMFKHPAQVGDEWVTLESTLRYEGIQQKTVPAGEFSCHLYSIHRYGETYSHSCIAEGVGVVYSDNLLGDGQWESSALLKWGTSSD